MRKINRIERIARREEKNTIKRIFILSIVSVVLVFLLLTLGVSLLGKLTDLLGLVFKGKTSASSSENITLQPPILDNIPQATNSAQLKITGFSSDGKKVDVYKNGEKVGDTTVDGGRFSYEDITLSMGSNEITLKTVSDTGSTSDFSRAVTIVFAKKEPKLQVDTPTDSQNFSGNNRIRVAGQTEKNAQVFANGFLANVDSDGKFDVTIPLMDGENTIEVKALDEAGNVKTVKLKVHFQR